MVTAGSYRRYIDVTPSDQPIPGPEGGGGGGGLSVWRAVDGAYAVPVVDSSNPDGLRDKPDRGGPPFAL